MPSGPFGGPRPLSNSRLELSFSVSGAKMKESDDQTSVDSLESLDFVSKASVFPSRWGKHERIDADVIVKITTESKRVSSYQIGDVEDVIKSSLVGGVTIDSWVAGVE